MLIQNNKEIENKKNLLSEILSKLQKKGAEQVELVLINNEQISINARDQLVELTESGSIESLSIRVIKEQRQANLEIQDLSLGSIDQACEKVLGFTKFSEHDSYAGIADASWFSPLDYCKLDIFNPVDIDVSDIQNELIYAESEGFGEENINNSEGSSFSASKTDKWLANSNGFLEYFASTYYSRSSCFLAQKGNSMERDYAFDCSRNYSSLRDHSEIAIEASRKAASRLNPVKIKSKEMPVLFSNEAARSIITPIISALSGGNQYQEKSFLLNSLGKNIASKEINFSERPYDPGMIATTPFDSEGVTIDCPDVIKNGMVERYFLSSYSGRKLGLNTTGNAGGVRNLLVHPTIKEFSQEVIKIPELFLVTELMGQGVNVITGDFSRGVTGVLLKYGEVIHPISEVTIAGNYKDLLHQIVFIGDDIDYRGKINTGSILIDKLSVSGK